MCVCFLFSLWKGPLARGAYVTKARDSIEGMACCANPPDDDADVMRIFFFIFSFSCSQSLLGSSRMWINIKTIFSVPGLGGE